MSCYCMATRVPQIEEHVEEVTTHHLTDEDDVDEDEDDVSDSGSWRGSRGSLEDRRRTRRHKKVTQHSVTQDPLVSCLPVALPDPAQVTSRRVSFPELGRDIIQGVSSCPTLTIPSLSFTPFSSPPPFHL